VRAEFALNDLTRLAAVDELDRILEADDVQCARGIQIIDHRGQRRGLAGAGRPSDQDHALVVIAQFAHDRRQIELLEGRRLGGDGPKHRADAGFLAEHIGAKAPAVGRYVGEIQIVAEAQIRDLHLRQHLVDVGLEFRFTEVAELDRHEIAMHAQHRRNADGEVQVRAALRRAELEERVDSGHKPQGYA
jgi:hypothetical protein